ncbi:hypothetical protein LLEC1_00774 [Akanthomyces lecanii]|uniref:Uncharacterized protein n=1 Tax=Cordyceps confragosa TaxID=2714763 RepID=A0A179I964_CORDF|nr:hypothetical protein LLEC1_00774 [Akanthomyces lecanii]
MVRGRAPARGTRRGVASAGTERPAPDAPAPASTPTDAPAANSSETTPASRGGTTRAARAPAAGRFRPRNVRRDEAERDSLARQEEKKASERAAEERKARGRSRFRSKRSRGDTMGRGGFGRIISGASGPFSSGNGAGPGRGGSGWFGGGGSGIGGGGGGGFGGRGLKSESKGLSFAQGRDIHREPRINADKLHIMSPEEELDSEDEAMIAALSSKDSSKMPMGIYRKEHKEAEIVVATTAELEAKENATGEEESLWVDGESGTLPPTDQPEEGVWSTESKPLIKEEPTAEDAMDVELASVPNVEDRAAAAAAAAATAPVKVKKALPQDPESKMIQSDLDLLARELGAVTVDGESAPELANKDGRLYLFQFPPLMPPLKETSTPQEPAKPVAVSGGGGASARPTGGDCVGMGKIMGRFVVAPVWSEEEDWDVAPQELQSA